MRASTGWVACCAKPYKASVVVQTRRCAHAWRHVTQSCILYARLLYLRLSFHSYAPLFLFCTRPSPVIRQTTSDRYLLEADFNRIPTLAHRHITRAIMSTQPSRRHRFPQTTDRTLDAEIPKADGSPPAASEKRQEVLNEWEIYKPADIAEFESFFSGADSVGFYTALLGLAKSVKYAKSRELLEQAQKERGTANKKVYRSGWTIKDAKRAQDLGRNVPERVRRDRSVNVSTDSRTEGQDFLPSTIGISPSPPSYSVSPVIRDFLRSPPKVRWDLLRPHQGCL